MSPLFKFSFASYALDNFQDGPLMYRSRTVFEDATPELVRDFFWDDDFRPKWDTMLAYFKVLEELPHVGSMIVHWIKKVCLLKYLFFFCHFDTKHFQALLKIFLCCAVPFLLQRSRIYRWSTNLGVWEHLLLCNKGISLYIVEIYHCSCQIFFYSQLSLVLACVLHGSCFMYYSHCSLLGLL